MKLKGIDNVTREFFISYANSFGVRSMGTSRNAICWVCREIVAVEVEWKEAKKQCKDHICHETPEHKSARHEQYKFLKNMADMCAMFHHEEFVGDKIAPSKNSSEKQYIYGGQDGR